MTDRIAHTCYLVLGIALAVIIAIAMDGELSISRSDGLWFEILVLVALAAFIFEPHFSGGASVTTNSVAVVFVVLGADRSRHGGWWIALACVAGLALLLGLVSYVGKGSTVSANGKEILRVCGVIAAALGSWRMLLLASLGLALASYNEPFEAEWTAALVVAFYCYVLSKVPPHRLFRRGGPELAGDAAVAAIYPPYEVTLTADEADALATHDIVEVASERGTAPGVVLSQVVYKGSQAWRTFVPSLPAVIPPPTGEPVFSARKDPQGALSSIKSELAATGVGICGVLAEGSSIGTAVIELAGDATVELGDVVWTFDGTARTLWQVTDATIAKTAWAGDARRITRVTAAQVGQWDEQNSTFAADIRSPKAAAVAFSGALVPDRTPTVPTGSIRFGILPKSPFPAMVDLAIMSRTHGAVLGSTGTGKTHLTFALIEGLRELGVKVVCLDLTGQYRTRFDDAVVASKVPDIIDFLNGQQEICICSPKKAEAIALANRISKACYDWAESQEPPLGPWSPARAVLVLEEAHNYIPEQFVINDWDLKATAQDTSRVIMESRKFGLGFLLVSQRTAMVTKSALSQCNTVFAFQSADQTGLDYLRGVCGPDLAAGIPTLPHRTVVAMGSGIRAARSIIAYVDDAAVLVP